MFTTSMKSKAYKEGGKTGRDERDWFSLFWPWY